MSSRKSSEIKFYKKESVNVSKMANTQKQNTTSLIVAILFSVLYNLLILGYIVTLEGQKCNCIRDWRHDFIKYYSISMIIYGLILLLVTGTSYRNSIFLIVLQCALLLLSFVNIWCLYTYIGDLDKTKCLCAIEKQKNMHYFLYFWRYILLGSAIFGLVMIIFTALFSKYFFRNKT